MYLSGYKSQKERKKISMKKSKTPVVKEMFDFCHKGMNSL